MKRILLSATVLFLLHGSVEQRCAAQDHQQPPGQNENDALQVAPEGKPTDQGDPRPQLHQRNPRYRIQANDMLELAFGFTPEFNQGVMVQPDGCIQLKGLRNDIHAQGMTVAELRDALRKAYSTILQDPVINVLLKDFDKPYFVAGGFVGKPGKYDLRGSTTATQAIAIAGGFAEGAKNSQVVLFRRYSDEWVETKTLNLKEILKGKKVNEDAVLQAGDMLFVPKSTFAKIEKFLPRTSLGTYFGPSTF
jgi:polysaccharide export outer membrane protein